MTTLHRMPTKEQIEEIASHVGFMKPHAVDEEKSKELLKMQECVNSSEYAMELKLDGCRGKLVAYRMYSKSGIDRTDNYPHLRDFFVALSLWNIVLDCEFFYPGKTSQFATSATNSGPEAAIAFQKKNGLIHMGIISMLRTPAGSWITNRAFVDERRLRELFYKTFIEGTPMEQYIHLPELITENKEQVYQRWIDEDREGGVLKKWTSTYTMGPSPKWMWFKRKQSDEIDLFIIGYKPPKKGYAGSQLADWPYWEADEPVTEFHAKGWFGALLLGAYDYNGKVKQVCAVSGMTKELREQISLDRDSYLRRVVKVNFMEFTEDGLPRHPQFGMFHESKEHHECVWEPEV